MLGANVHWLQQVTAHETHHEERTLELVPYLSATRTALSSCPLDMIRSSSIDRCWKCAAVLGSYTHQLCVLQGFNEHAPATAAMHCDRAAIPSASRSHLIYMLASWRPSRNASPNHASCKTPGGWRHRSHANQSVRDIIAVIYLFGIIINYI